MSTQQKSPVPAQKEPKMKIPLIGKTKAAELINDSKGRFFTATFRKKNGESRVINCRRGVTKGVKGTGKAINTDVLGMITVYAVQEKGYKKLNLQTLTNLRINKCEYRIRK